MTHQIDLTLENKNIDLELESLTAGEEKDHVINVKNTTKYDFIKMIVGIKENNGMIKGKKSPKEIPANSSRDILLHSTIPLDVKEPVRGKIQIKGEFWIK